MRKTHTFYGKNKSLTKDTNTYIWIDMLRAMFKNKKGRLTKVRKGVNENETIRNG